MRPSTLLTAFGAGLAIASPLVKKALVTEVVTDIVYEYITETSSTSTPSVATTVVTLVVYPTQAPVATTSSSSTTSTSSAPTTTSTPPPPPPPTTEAAAPSTTYTPPPPAPPTSDAPAPAPTTVVAAAAASSAAPSPAPVNNAGGGLPTGTDFQSVVIYHHNIHRQNHSAADASYDTTMAQYAQTVADSCHYAHDRTEGDGNYGQNIAAYGATGDSDFGASKAVAMAITSMWYNGEVNSYLPSYFGKANPDMSNVESWNHFSQVVWDGSTGIGCAATLCPDGSIFKGFSTWFTVCNYFPVGNMADAYGTNVFKGNGADTVQAS